MHFRTFLNGVLVGVLLGVLFAPDSGEETRKKLSRRAQGIKDSYDDLADDVSSTYRKAKDNQTNLLAVRKINLTICRMKQNLCITHKDISVEASVPTLVLPIFSGGFYFIFGHCEPD